MERILVIDAGTTSVRAIVYGMRCEVLGSHQLEFTQFFPQPGWVEHDPNEIWEAVLQCCHKALQASATMPNMILGIGITNQRETTIVWDRNTGKSYGNAITWQDRRTAQLCHQLAQQKLEPLIYEKTGLLLDPYFCATKIQWILEHYQLQERATTGEILFGTIDTYLLYRLTAGQVHDTDITNASRTLLFNIQEQCWDEDLLALFAVSKSMLPTVQENCVDFGRTDLFGRSIPIVAMMGDQQAAMIGQACFTAGDAKCTYGTGSFLMVNTGEQRIPSTKRLLNTIAFKINGTVNYAIEGSIFVAGAVIQWLRDQLHMINSSAEVESLAAGLPDNGGVYLVPAFTGLGAPYWDPLARGAIFGLTRDTQDKHFARAALEAIAYQSKDLVLTLQEVCHLTALRVDGGATSNRWLMQFVADVLQIPILVSENKEATSLGVAYLVMLSLGRVASLNQLSGFSGIASTFNPCMSMDEVDRLYGGWLHAVGRVRS